MIGRVITPLIVKNGGRIRRQKSGMNQNDIGADDEWVASQECEGVIGFTQRPILYFDGLNEWSRCWLISC